MKFDCGNPRRVSNTSEQNHRLLRTVKRTIAVLSSLVALGFTIPVGTVAAYGTPTTSSLAPMRHSAGMTLNCSLSSGDGLAAARRQGICPNGAGSSGPTPANVTYGNCGTVTFYIYDYGYPGYAETWIYFQSSMGVIQAASEFMTIYNATLDRSTTAWYWDSGYGRGTLQANHYPFTDAGYVTIADAGTVYLDRGIACSYPPAGQYLYDQASIS